MLLWIYNCASTLLYILNNLIKKSFRICSIGKQFSPLDWREDSIWPLSCYYIPDPPSRKGFGSPFCQGKDLTKLKFSIIPFTQLMRTASKHCRNMRSNWSYWRCRKWVTETAPAHWLDVNAKRCVRIDCLKKKLGLQLWFTYMALMKAIPNASIKIAALASSCPSTSIRGRQQGDGWAFSLFACDRKKRRQLVSIHASYQNRTSIPFLPAKGERNPPRFCSTTVLTRLFRSNFFMENLSRSLFNSSLFDDPALEKREKLQTVVHSGQFGFTERLTHY